MINYSGYYFDFFSLNFVTQFILALSMTVYLVSLKNKTEPTRWFLAFFGTMSIYTFVSILKVTSIWQRAFFMVHVQSVLFYIIAMILVQFAYRFPALRCNPGATRIDTVDNIDTIELKIAVCRQY